MNLDYIEMQLRKRLAYPYKWPRIQDNSYDNLTSFVYDESDFDKILDMIDLRLSGQSNFGAKRDYALIRWFNYWSAQAIEHIFAQSSRVVPSPNARSRITDFYIDGVSFDHKTTVFPRGYQKSLRYALDNPASLIEWLYLEQSQQQRHHFKNRLFIVLHAKDREHWRLKADISWLQSLINNYLQDFSDNNLYRLNFETGSPTLADVIWAMK